LASPEAAALVEKAASFLSPAAAEKTYLRAVKLAPRSPEHRYNLALFYKRAQNAPAMKRGFSAFLRLKEKADAMQVYCAAVTVDDYALACRCAEKILAEPAADRVFSRLWNPWGDRSSSLPQNFFADRLKALEKAAFPAGFGFYRTFFRAALFFYMGLSGEAKREFSRLKVPDENRCGWMRFPAGWLHLYECDYATAFCEFEKSSKSPFEIYAACGRMAEILICAGRRAEGFALFRKMRSNGRDLGAKYGWEGQMRLFTGQYRKAVSLLDKAAALGDDAAWCWRGAAKLKLGDFSGALSDLARALVLFPTDNEARVWLAETLRLKNDFARSRAELDSVLSASPNNRWALFNLALIESSLGNREAMANAFSKIEPSVTLCIARRLRIARERDYSKTEMKKILSAGLKLSFGNRRDDVYFDPIWTGKSCFIDQKGYNYSF